MTIYRSCGKRTLDLVLAIILLILLIPLLLGISLWIIYESGKPVLFVQRRIGLHGKVFQIFKFRTMLGTPLETNTGLNDALRITRSGSFLRKTGLDEVPQLLNVIKGEMSIIGPRPLLEIYQSSLSEKQYERHQVRPGITGLAQINGRNSIPWSEKFQWDLYYVYNISLKEDLAILIKTFFVVFSNKGTNFDDKTTMPPFTG